MSRYQEDCEAFALYSSPEEEHAEFHYSSLAELDAEEARIYGEANPDRAWILTGADVWHANPYYKGPEVPHPEAYDINDEYDDVYGDNMEEVGEDQVFNIYGDEIPY